MSAGTVFVEIDLDYSKFEKNQAKLIQSSQSTSLSVEKNWQNLGAKSDRILQAQANSAINSYNMIANKAGSSMEEISRAHYAMSQKIKASEDERFAHQNQLWTNMGVRSNAQIEAQKKQVMDSYNVLLAGAKGNHSELLRLEAAKNEKLKRLHQEMTGQHEQSFAAMQRNILRYYATFYIASQALQTFVVPFVKGFKAVEEYNTAIASMAAMVVTFGNNMRNLSLEDQWRGALSYSTKIIPVLEKIAAKTLLSGQETIALANAFARSGVFLDENNKKQIESFTRISNALPLMTQGQEITRQINTEVRSLMTGMNEQSSMMLITLKSIDPQIEKHLVQWRAEDTVLEHIGDLLKGFGPATEILEKQWKAVSTSIDTTANQILRGAMKPAYEDIIKLTQEFDKWLQENKKSITEIATLLVRIGGSGLRALVENINTLFIPIRQFLAMYDYSMKKIEQWKRKDGSVTLGYWDNVAVSAQEKSNQIVMNLMKQLDAEILKGHKETQAEFDKVTQTQVAAFRSKEVPPSELFINEYIKKRMVLKEQQFQLDKKSEDAAKKAADEAKRLQEQWVDTKRTLDAKIAGDNLSNFEKELIKNQLEADNLKDKYKELAPELRAVAFAEIYVQCRID